MAAVPLRPGGSGFESRVAAARARHAADARPLSGPTGR